MMINMSTIMESNLMRSKFRGSLLGVVIGDCLGSSYEGEYNISRVVLQRYFDKLTGPYFKGKFTFLDLLVKYGFNSVTR